VKKSLFYYGFQFRLDKMTIALRQTRTVFAMHRKTRKIFVQARHPPKSPKPNANNKCTHNRPRLHKLIAGATFHVGKNQEKATRNVHYYSNYPNSFVV